MRNTKTTSLLRTSLHARTDTREDDPDAAEGFKDLFVFLAFLVWTTTRGSILLLLQTRVVSTHLSANVFPFRSFGFFSLWLRRARSATINSSLSKTSIKFDNYDRTRWTFWRGIKSENTDGILIFGDEFRFI